MNDLSPGKKRFVKRQLRHQQPTVIIGKSGVTENLLAEIGEQIEKHKMVKIKILKTALVCDDAKTIAQKISAQTNSVLVETRGHTIMLYKSRKK